MIHRWTKRALGLWKGHHIHNARPQRDDMPDLALKLP